MPKHGNPLDPHDITRLYSSITYSRTALQPFRTNRLAAIKQYVGAHYAAEETSVDSVPLNLLELAVQTYKHLLAAQAPREFISTPHDHLKSSALLLELALEHLVKEIKLKQTLQEVVVDALFGIGILKLGLERGGSIEIDGERHELGQPFADSVHLDDWVHDASARRWGECSFMGNRYRLFLDHAQEEPTFVKSLREELVATQYDPHNESGDERAEEISAGAGRGDGGYRDVVELWDLYLPFDNLMITLPFTASANIDKPLRIVEYDGPEAGPYRRLGFSDISDNVMPLPEVAGMMDMHLLANSIMRKLGRQAKRQKTQLLFRRGEDEDAEAIRKGSDGELVGVNDPGSVQEVSYGGIDPRSLAFLIQVKELFSYQAGNLDALAGLAAMSETVGQDKLISRAAAGRIEHMQIIATEFAHDILTSLAWYLFTDPFIDLPLTKRIPGTSIEIPTSFNEETREGDFLDYNFKMEPHSMQFLSPQARLAIVNDTLNRVGPFMPMMQEQGITFNVRAYLELTSDLTGVDQIKDIFIFSGSPPGGETPIVGRPPTKAPVSHRTYERINTSAGTGPSRDSAMKQALMAAGQQEQTNAP